MQAATEEPPVESDFDPAPTDEAEDKTGWEVYPQMEDAEPNNATGEFGWRRRGADGEITAIGGEGFTREEDAERAIREHLAAVYRELLPAMVPIEHDSLAVQAIEIKRVAS